MRAHEDGEAIARRPVWRDLAPRWDLPYAAPGGWFDKPCPAWAIGAPREVAARLRIS